jgi:hypothetical protein
MKTFAVAFTLLCVIPLNSTTVVVIRTPRISLWRQIVVSLGQQQTSSHKGMQNPPVKGRDRLVKGSNDIFYASSGFSLDLQKQLVQEDVRHASSIAQAADTFSQQGDILAQNS